MLPALIGGCLPPGIYSASLADVIEAFGFNAHRLWLVVGLRLALADLRQAGCAAVYLDGSFVTDKARPGDFDLCWDTAGVDFARLHPVILEIRAPRTSQKLRYYGDILPNVREASSGAPFTDFFQNIRDSNKKKGIVLLNPQEASS